MKYLTKLEVLIKLLTRGYESEGSKAASLRENQFSNTFTPNDRGEFPKVVNPFKELPNVSTLKLCTNRDDPLLEKFGVSRKLSPEMTFDVLSWRVKAANRYMRIMHLRLSKLLWTNKPKGYWVLACMLMKDSKVLRAIALRKFDLNWHKKYKLGSVKLWLGELDHKLNNLVEELSIKRRYVDKIKGSGEVTLRPIGSPSYPDRMYLYIWQCFLMMYVCQFISKSQHAYIKGRGVPTALKELREALANPKYKFVWEFDLKGAFPSVFIPEAMRSLESHGLPQEICNFLQEMSLLTVEEVDLKEARDRGLGTTANKPFPEVKFIRQDNIRQGPVPRFAMIGREIALEFSKTRHPDHQPVEFKGFPQGSGISPILFDCVFEIAALRGHFLKLNPNVKVISYADDFLVFSEIDIPSIFEPSRIMLDHGLRFNLEKSRCLKSADVWTATKFVFLGTTWKIGPHGIELFGTPRSGGELEFTPDKALMAAKFAERDKVLSKLGRETVPGVRLTADQVLAAWGQGKAPFHKLPLGFMEGTEYWSMEQLKELLVEGSSTQDYIGYKNWENDEFRGDDASSESLGNANIPLWVKTNDPAKYGLSELEIQGILEEEAAGIERENATPHDLSNLRMSHSGHLDFFATRLKGLIINRLHGTSWISSAAMADRSLKSPERTKGRSWLELKLATVNLHKNTIPNIAPINPSVKLAKLQSLSNFRENLSIYTSTSFATVDLLKGLRNSKTLKIKRGSLPL